MQRPTTTALVALLASATFFGGAVLAQTDHGAGHDADRVAPADTSGIVRGEPNESGGANDQSVLARNVQVYTVPAPAFTPDGLQPGSQTYGGLTGTVRGTAAEHGCILAPVTLPQGARIDRMEVSFWDNDPAESFGVLLRRLSNAQSGDHMADAGSFGFVSSPQVRVDTDTTVKFDVIDNVEWTYYLSTCLNSPALVLYSVKIFYQEDPSIDPHSPVIVPVTPFRAYDSRFADGPLGEGESRLVSVRRSIDIETGAVIKNNAIPAGATAIMFNLAVTNTLGAGFLAATPGDATGFSSASINWSATGQTFNNGTFVELDGDRQIRAFVGGTPGAQTDFVIDITGYVLPGG